MEVCLHAVPEKVYAVKIISKTKLIREGKAKTAVAERSALAKLGSGKHAGFLRLYNAFQDPTHLYLVMDVAQGGDLQLLVKEYGSFSHRVARYYTAQIVDAVLWMHSQGVLHRDLKPENALLDANLRIKLADFGCVYIAQNSDLSPRKSTFVGSAAYVSPELLDKTLKTTSAASDIWAIGCILFYLVSGQLAFLAPTDYLTFKKIEAHNYSFPEGFYDDAKDLVERLLILEPSDRLGVAPKSSPVALREHQFFSSGNIVGGRSEKIGDGLSGNIDDGKSASHDEPGIDWDSLWTGEQIKLESGIRAPTPMEPEEQSFDSFVADFSRTTID
ncbi:kinase-like domain-containing protein [Schizophyllum amplum]|uniref:non-specific serine/threonine protein kinase n=1 Tax=Schizophyllum amplum TaxID=97359 RepID=A0A550CBM2_9AGAR|nr:kinase-like domain-containing protein [Auriculariopsis ampla]